jgi:glycine betaine/proline transport system ATP-binding protein
VLNPADAYIADFIKEVNRGRVISVETIMHKTPIEGAVNIVLNSSDRLETAAQAMAQAQETSANVCDDSNKLIGSIHLKDTINAMVTAASH